ncbi:MAG: hypothetical protein IT168_11510 [Bryobacterales bacterium]|nr:hypothetical protein [Bryobacterales bacterium]
MSNPPPPPTGAVPPVPDWIGPAAVLSILLLCLGFFAQRQNSLFYEKFAPFFDSAPYNNALALAVSDTNSQGAIAAFRSSLHSTGPLPLFETILLTKLGIVKTPVTRALGVWLQMIWLSVLAFAMFAYLHFCRRLNPAMAVVYTLPFIAFEGIFYYNGGLSDFRLDLSLYLLSSVTVTFYLFTYWRDSYLWWLAAGVCAGLTCLTRATAAIYLPIMLGPIIFARLCFSARRWRILAGVGVMLIPAALISLAYLLYTYEYLHYYYVVWNADANAKLPLRESVIHFRLAYRHIGFYPALVLAFALLTGILDTGVRRSLRLIDWKLLYLGLAPLLFLVLRGAGPNPFVCMPAVFGFTLFALAPVNVQGPKSWSFLRAIAACAIVTTCLYSAARVPARDTANLPPMAGMRKTIDLLKADAGAAPEIRFMTTHIGTLQASLLRNVLVYEYEGLLKNGGVRDPQGTLWLTPLENQFSPAVPIVWEQEVKGVDDTAKIEYLLNESRKHLDYLTFPEDSTIAWLERNLPHYANLKVGQIKKRFLQSGEWTPIGDVIEIVPHERFRIYAKVSPNRPASAR